jgi:hypothetical protein
MDAPERRKELDYYNKFDCVLAAGLEGYEIPFRETEFGRECESDPLMNQISNLIGKLLVREESTRNRTPLYNKIAELVRKNGKRIFVPYQEAEFKGLWTKREIDVFRDVLVPEADFVICDVYDLSPLKNLALEALEIGSNLMLFLDENPNLVKILASKERYKIRDFPYQRAEDCIGLYPLIGKNDEELLLKLEHFLRQFYRVSS